MKTIYKKLLFLLLLLPFSVFAQSALEGTVTDKSSKQPLPGVNVIIQGTTAGTQTDFDGKFKISGKAGDKVVFSYLGYKNAVINFSAQSNLNVSLEEESNQLQEVVVQVGYGSVRKKDATGAVELITAKDFNKGAITSVEGLLNGRASGVVITASGTPGDNPVIRIRGGSSLLANNDPLIVVDGLPLEGVTLASINPNDIETFSILKDASSAAIYGNRGSNGVILITTKKGSKKGIQVNFSTFTTLNTLAKKQEVYSADEFRTLITEKVPTQVGQLGTANTDWQKQIFKDSYSSDISASVLGNIFGKVPARLSLGHTDNNGILLTSEFKRSTGSFALNPSLLDDHLKINFTGNYAYTFVRKADEGAIGSAISFDPTQAVYDPTSPFGGYTESYDISPNGEVITPRGPSNPVSQLLEKRNIRNVKRYYGNFNLDYKLHFFPDLRVILNYGYEKNEGNSLDKTTPLSRSGFNTTLGSATGNTYLNGQVGNYSRSQDDNFERINENRNAQLNYIKTIGKLNVDILAGYDWQQQDEEKYGTGNEYLYGLGQNAEANIDTYTSPGNNLQAYLGRLKLGFDNRYLLTVNFRRDGSTKISPVNRWANFWGAAFAWRIKEENFLKNSTVFSDLKLRLSYGETGQQNLPNPYSWIKKYNISGNAYYQFGNEFYLVARPDGYNLNLKWEKSTKYNVGLDFAFLNNRLQGNIDGYFSETTDLFAYTNQGALGNLYIFGPTNIGSLETKGAELGLTADVIKSENFDLSFNYNVSYTKVELTSLFTDNLPVNSLGDGLYAQTHKVGLAPNAFWLYEQIYDANGRPIEGAYVDRNGDGIVNSKDKYNAGKPQADVTMGFLTNATIYKNWDFSMGWRASFGNDVYDKVSADRSTLGGLYSSFSATVQNTTTDYSNTNFTANVKESDYYLKNGAFLKCDNITVGYNFRKLLRSENTNLRLYGGVQNVLIITKYKGIDPEVFNNGVDGTIFPRARMFMLGFNANF